MECPSFNLRGPIKSQSITLSLLLSLVWFTRLRASISLSIPVVDSSPITSSSSVSLSPSQSPLSHSIAKASLGFPLSFLVLSLSCCHCHPHFSHPQDLILTIIVAVAPEFSSLCVSFPDCSLCLPKFLFCLPTFSRLNPIHLVSSLTLTSLF